MTECNSVVKYMRETVKKPGKGPRGSHCTSLASVKGTYRVYRPTNHDRSWKFSDHVTGDRTMQPTRDRDRETLLGRNERDSLRLRLAKRDLISASYFARWSFYNVVFVLSWKITKDCQMRLERGAVQISLRYPTRIISTWRIGAIDLQHVASIAEHVRWRERVKTMDER